MERTSQIGFQFLGRLRYTELAGQRQRFCLELG